MVSLRGPLPAQPANRARKAALRPAWFPQCVQGARATCPGAGACAQPSPSQQPHGGAAPLRSHAHAPTAVDVAPYVLVEKIVVLSTTWPQDAAQMDAAEVTQRLQGCGALEVSLSQVAPYPGTGEAASVSLAVTARPSDREQLVAAIMHATPAWHVRIANEERAFLATHPVAISTPWGHVDVEAVLAGSTVVGVAARRAQCAAAAATAGVDAALVAAEAEARLRSGLQDGSVRLGLEYIS